MAPHRRLAGRRRSRRRNAAARLAAAAAPVDGDLADLRSRGSLRVLVGADEDPIWFSQRGGPSPGFEREVLEGFARVQRLRFEVVPVPRWEEAIPMLLRQEGDVLGGISVTPERRQKVDFSVRAAAGAEHRRHAAAAGADPLARRAAGRAGRDRAQHRVGRGARQGRRSRLAHAAHGRRLRGGRDDPRRARRRDRVRGRRFLPAAPPASASSRRACCSGSRSAARGPSARASPELRQALDAYLGELRRSANWSRLLVKYFGADAPAILGHEPVK